MNNENKNIETNSKTSKKISKQIKKSKNITINKFEDLEGKFIHVKVGNFEDPASDEQISNIQKEIVKLFQQNNVNCLVFVTHHAVSMEIIEKKINGGVTK